MRKYALLTALLAAPTLFGQPQAEESPAARAARERQEKLPILDFTFRIQETVEPGAMQREVLRGGASPAKFPAERLSFDSTSRLLYDGNRIRHEDNHPMPDERTLIFEPSTAVKVSDGRLVKYFYHPIGHERRRSQKSRP
jgi:hypothetical protein